MKPKNNMKSNIIIIIILAILLITALGFIGYSQYNKAQEKKQITAYATYEQGRQQGFQQGYIQAVGQLYNEALRCQAVPVTFNNQTINMIAIECLRQQTTQQTPSQSSQQTQQPFTSY